ncbi:MAG: hypothetical protein P1V13_00005, partial [Rhizobiaceae bacterium]|nr:hypothetical protein [Rhizobiaceae bacterium]
MDPPGHRLPMVGFFVIVDETVDHDGRCRTATTIRIAIVKDMSGVVFLIAGAGQIVVIAELVDGRACLAFIDSLCQLFFCQD